MVHMIPSLKDVVLNKASEKVKGPEHGRFVLRGQITFLVTNEVTHALGC